MDYHNRKVQQFHTQVTTINMSHLWLVSIPAVLVYSCMAFWKNHSWCVHMAIYCRMNHHWHSTHHATRVLQRYPRAFTQKFQAKTVQYNQLAVDAGISYTRTVTGIRSHTATIVHGPLARYVKLRVAHASWIPGTISPSPRVNDPDMHHGKCVTHLPWCMPGWLTSGFLWSRWRGKRSRPSRRMRDPQLYVSGKMPISAVQH